MQHPFLHRGDGFKIVNESFTNSKSCVITKNDDHTVYLQCCLYDGVLDGVGINLSS